MCARVRLGTGTAAHFSHRSTPHLPPPRRLSRRLVLARLAPVQVISFLRSRLVIANRSPALRASDRSELVSRHLY